MIYYSVLNNLTTQMSVVILSEKREDNSSKGKKIVTMVCFSAVLGERGDCAPRARPYIHHCFTAYMHVCIELA